MELLLDSYSKAQPIKKLSILMPVLNEILTLEITLSKLFITAKKFQFPYEIIIVDSNSTDGSREYLLTLNESNNIKLIFEEYPKGKGYAIRKAMSQMTGDVFLIFDADNEYDSNDILKLIPPIENGQSSFVIGSRHWGSTDIRTFESKVFLATLMNLGHVFFVKLINLFFQSNLRDPFSMYKVMRVEIFKNYNFTSDRFDLDWEFVCISLRKGVNIIEIPIRYNSRSFDEGKKIRFFYDPSLWIIALFKFKFRKI